MTSVTPPRRALLSVFDKSGVVDFARGLVDLGWELISSGGTAEVVSAAGIPVTDVADYTGSPIMLGHRVATLHPRLHGGILADREDPEHQADLRTHDIEVIDLVVGNLYPFGSEPGIEMIDIGGPTLLRSAAKNHAYVGVATNPADYEPILTELRANDRNTGLSDATRRRLARAAFAHTAAYDAAIVDWVRQQRTGTDTASPHDPPGSRTGRFPPLWREPASERGRATARWGAPSMWDQIEQYSGVPLSYLNIFDADAAWRLAHELGALADNCAVAIIKHANPCGAAVAENLADAYLHAFECDPRSAFGGIVAVNRIVDEPTVEAMESAAQADVIIAPGYADGGRRPSRRQAPKHPYSVR